MALSVMYSSTFGSTIKSVIMLLFVAVLLVNIMQLSDPADYDTDR